MTGRSSNNKANRNGTTPDITAWPSVRIDSIGEVQGGRQRSEKIVKGNPRKYLRVANVFNGFIDYSTAYEMLFTEAEERIYELLPGDILLNEGQSLELVGRSAIYDGLPREYCFQNTLIRFRPSPQILSAFAQQVFQFYLTTGVFAAIAARTTSIAHLGVERFASLRIPIPPLPEQRAIAAVLSAWDRAIGQTTALIAAKQRLKQGLMQQLFGEAAHSQRQLDSKLCQLGDVASETTRRNGGGLGTDSVYSVTKANGMIPMPVDTIGSDIARYKLVRPKAFAYNPMRINIGSIARWEGDCEALVSPDYVVFECGPELDPDYLNHFRRGHVWDSYVKRSGDGSVRVRIYFDHLSRMRIRLPGIQEQRRIAKVLDASNADLRLLEQKLNALKQQKRGLMQQLLTGNTRLPTKPGKVKDE